MRSKLKLNLDELTIDSFDTTSRESGRGTVVGEEQCTCWTQCGQNTCPGCPTCGETCNANVYTCAYSCDTCDGSCGGSCWYTECPTNGQTCNPSNDPWQPCCPQ